MTFPSLNMFDMQSESLQVMGCARQDHIGEKCHVCVPHLLGNYDDDQNVKINLLYSTRILAIIQVIGHCVKSMTCCFSQSVDYRRLMYITLWRAVKRIMIMSGI